MISSHVVASGCEQPIVYFIVDDDRSRLRARAREICDDSWSHWSRSYSRNGALIVGWHHRVGVDFEYLDQLRDPTWSVNHDIFRSSIMTADERERWPVNSDGDDTALATSVWCSKEALAKALGTPLKMDPARLSGPSSWSDAPHGVWRATSLGGATFDRDAVAWVVFEQP